jgi:hypothetical protein
MKTCEELRGSKLPLTRTIVVGWYDGIVDALVTMKDDPRCYYGRLIAANADRKRRIFGITPILDPLPLVQAANEADGTEERWAELRRQISRHLQETPATTIYLLCEDFEGTILDCSEIDLQQEHREDLADIFAPTWFEQCRARMFPSLVV